MSVRTSSIKRMSNPRARPDAIEVRAPARLCAATSMPTWGIECVYIKYKGNMMIWSETMAIRVCLCVWHMRACGFVHEWTIQARRDGRTGEALSQAQEHVIQWWIFAGAKQTPSIPALWCIMGGRLHGVLIESVIHEQLSSFHKPVPGQVVGPCTTVLTF